MDKITCMIADDDDDCRQNIRLMLQSLLPCETIYETTTEPQTLAVIQKQAPQLVFMGTGIAPNGGFGMLARCSQVNFALIVVSANEQYALQAIKANAIDYLLKPVYPHDLETALDKALRKKAPGIAGEQIAATATEPDGKEGNEMFPVRVGNYYELLSIDEIVFCRALNNYTEIVLRDKRKFLLSKTLKFYENRLKNNQFCRIHQSFLVNIKFIKSIERGKHSRILLKDGTVLEIAQARREYIFRQLGF